MIFFPLAIVWNMKSMDVAVLQEAADGWLKDLPQIQSVSWIFYYSLPFHI